MRPSTNAHVVQSGWIHGGSVPPKPPNAYAVMRWRSGSSASVIERISVSLFVFVFVFVVMA
jgi:hypothetical protein